MNRQQRGVMRTFRQMLYRMKRQSGQPLAIYRVTQSTPNRTTGAIAPTSKSKIEINRAVILPVRTNTKFEYDLGFVAANKNFTYGGLFKVGDREILIDYADLPVDFVLNKENDYIVIEGQRYNIEMFDDFGYKIGIYAYIRKTQDQPSYQSVEYTMIEYIVPLEEFEGTI